MVRVGAACWILPQRPSRRGGRASWVVDSRSEMPGNAVRGFTGVSTSEVDRLMERLGIQG